jgi:hypothetical protein
MKDSQKKTAMQAGLMVVLFLMLAGLAVRMVVSMKPHKHPKSGSTVTASSDSSTPAAGGKGNGDTPSATNMPPVPRSGDQKDKAAMELSQADLHLNPSQFKVYALSPPKNPFVQSEDWYSDQLHKIPGYPQLKNSTYFESADAYLPDIPLINQEQWASISVDRSVKDDSFQISGTSEDGSISTSVKLTPKSAPSSQLNWTPATGVPVKELMKPGVKQRYGELLSGQLDAVTKNEESNKSGFVADALGVPGDGHAGPSGELLNGDGGPGDSLYAVGVSHHGSEATALIRMNGRTHIVREGSVLPTHYQVLTIKENGVVVIDLRDGKSNWLPLGAAPADDGKGKPAKVKSA